MKSLLKIYGKYMVLACLVIFLIFFVNIALLILAGNDYMKSSSFQRGVSRHTFRKIAGEIMDGGADGGFSLTEKGLAYLEDNGCAFAMVLSGGGDTVWEWRMPPELPRHYSAADVAAFTRWYLMDYPVNVWRLDGDMLMVCGYPKGSVWKHGIEYPMDWIDNGLQYMARAVAVNLLVILAVVLLFGYRFYRSLRPLAGGIGALARQESIRLPERGTVSDLCAELNQTSEILNRQRESLQKRDTARTEWISGVSHDIRTPLSMIVGYADSLETDEALPPKQRRQAGIIRQQSLKIKKLIGDLNLTSKLEYNMQPLRKEDIPLAPFLREIAASCLNGELTEKYELSLSIGRDAEGAVIFGDRDLLGRALTNLIGNSIKHNENGCRIRLTAERVNDGVCAVCVGDDGKGIPRQVTGLLTGEEEPGEGSPHIMGLRIAKQIVAAHGGTFFVSEDGRTVTLNLPAGPLVGQAFTSLADKRETAATENTAI